MFELTVVIYESNEEVGRVPFVSKTYKGACKQARYFIRRELYPKNYPNYSKPKKNYETYTGKRSALWELKTE